MKRLLGVILAIFMLTGILAVCAAAESAADLGYIVISEYIDISDADVSNAIQSVIDANPNRTIYFPDGTYNLSKSIYTPANPRKSVDLRLSNYAIIKANPDFEGEALVRLGGKDAFNDTRTNGSNYSLTGGIIDGSGIADGISIDSGRETKICDVSIKNTVTGINVKYGANSGSSDSDIRDCNIIGTGNTDSVGILLEGYDNTVTNIRIGNTFTGMLIKSGGNSFTNIHPLYTSDYTDYENACAFRDEAGGNTYNYCYSDQYCIGFYLKKGSNIYTDCFAYWYSSNGGREIVFKTDGCFDSRVNGIRVGFREDTENYILQTGKPGIGAGCLDKANFDASRCKGLAKYEWYMTDSFLYSVKCFIFAVQRFFRSIF